MFSSFPRSTAMTQLCSSAPASHRWMLPLTNHFVAFAPS